MSVVLLLVTVALGAFVHRGLLGRFGAGFFAHLVRLPGNLLHELAHAVALVATGYSVAGFTVSLADPAGRGGVKPGPAWTSLARPWLANLVAPVAPVAAGLVALWAITRWAPVPGLPTSIAAIGPVVLATPWDRWEVWAGLALGFSVTAEIAPSDIDLAGWWRPALVAAVLAAAGAYALDRYAPGTLAVQYAALDAAMWPRVTRALALAVWSGVVFAPVAWLVGKIRGL